MKVHFYGVRGSLPTPGKDTVRYGGNTSCVEVIIPDSDQIMIIDAGTGIHKLGNRIAPMRNKTINLFISHTHWDHIQGFPFFAPIYMPHHKINVYGPTNDHLGVSLQDILTTRQMDYAVFPVRQPELQASISFVPMKKETTMIGDIEVMAHPHNHPVLTLGYSIAHRGRRVVYQSDHEPYLNPFPDAAETDRFAEEQNQIIVEFAAGADLLIADATYTPAEYETHRNWGHSSTLHVLERAIAAKVKRLVLFHHDPMHSDDFLDKHLAEVRAQAEARGAQFDITMAREGEEIDLA